MIHGVREQYRHGTLLTPQLPHPHKSQTKEDYAAALGPHSEGPALWSPLPHVCHRADSQTIWQVNRVSGIGLLFSVPPIPCF